MFVDSVKIKIKAGDGGHGAATLSRTAQTARGGPDGGNGGNGGNIYVIGSHNIHDLSYFRYKKKIVAQNGEPGRGKNHFGKNAPHLTIEVPVGTIIKDQDTGQEYVIVSAADRRLIARGGTGGRGNFAFKSATNQTPRTRELGTPGQERNLFLDLQLIADIGLVGLPNAGKSSLLAAITNAKPAIADYPFTTLEPNIGVFTNLTIADIPGLISGAAAGRGLGVKFLKHISKTKLLVHCIAASDPDAMESYRIVRRELKEYNPDLLTRPELIVLTKTDLINADHFSQVKARFADSGLKATGVSVYDEKSVVNFKELVQSEYRKTL